MRSVTASFRTAMKQPVKEIDGSLYIAENDQITSSGDLISFIVDGEAKSVGKSVLRKLTATYLGTRNLVGLNIQAKYGVKVNGAFEYSSLGTFLVTQCETNKETGMTTLTGYDKMIYSIINYLPTLFSYPTTVGGLLTQVATAMNIELATQTIPFADLPIEEDLYANISGYQYRNIIEEIAILGGQVAIIDKDDKLRFRSIKTPDNSIVDNLTYADLKKLKIYDKYGVVNSLVLSRQPQEDNVILQDEPSIEENGMTEIKIANNEIVDKRREALATSIFDYYVDTTYFPFTADTTGFGWFEAGDKMLITDDEAVVREVRVMGSKITIDGSIKEQLYSNEPTKTETNYARAGRLDNRIKNTEIIVDKQQQTITSVVSDVQTLDGITTDNFTTIFQDLTNIIQSVQVSGGINLLKNSAFYQTKDDKTPTMWDMTGSGTFNIQTSTEAVNKGSLSANIITLRGVKVTQKVNVVADTSEIPEAKKTYYSFKALVKKGVLGEARIRIYNDKEEYVWVKEQGEAVDYDDVTFEAMLPKSNYYNVELWGDQYGESVFTDAMFSVGKYTSAWQQANGEILNTNVTINEQGIIVRSSVYEGDYTAITPLEFSGYSKVGGTIVKAFTLNKDRTEVKKLYSTDEIAMPPIKIVPITSGSVTGWAFVKRGAN